MGRARGYGDRVRLKPPVAPGRAPGHGVDRPREETTRLHPILNLLRYDQRRLLGLLAALRPDPVALVAGLSILIVSTLGLAWALINRAPDLTPEMTAALGFIAGVVLGRSPDPLPGLRAGPLRELADDRVAVAVWLCLRALAVLAILLLIVVLAALLMGGRPDVALLAPAAAAGAGIVAGVGLRLYLPKPTFRIPAIIGSAPSRPSPCFHTRVARLSWIELARFEAGLPVGLWAAAAWAGSLLIGLTGTEPRLVMLADGAAAVLAFLAAVLTLRFDAATARLLSFEPTSFFRLAVDVLGARLLVVLAAGLVIAVAAAPAALAGVALGAGLRTLEFLHGVGRSPAAARLLAQLETALVAAIAVVAGPAALVWLILRTAWLYRRAGRAMGLA